MKEMAMANAPVRGRNTKGGLVMTSRPFSVLPPPGLELRGALEATSGVGVGEGDGVGAGVGVGVGATSVKFAQGLGATVAHSLWRPGASPGYGFTRTLKFPFPSAVAEALEGCESQ